MIHLVSLCQPWWPISSIMLPTNSPPLGASAKDKRGQGAMLLALAEAQLAKALAGEALSHWTAGIAWVMGGHGHKDRWGQLIRSDHEWLWVTMGDYAYMILYDFLMKNVEDYDSGEARRREGKGRQKRQERKGGKALRSQHQFRQAVSANYHGISW